MSRAFFITPRLALLLTVAAVLAALTVMFPAPDSQPVDAGHTAKRSASASSAAPPNSARDTSDPGNLFAARVQPMRSAAPKAQAIAAPAPTAVPVPTLPYRYLGRYKDGATSTVYLSANERSVPIKPGDVLDEQFRVDEIAADHVRFTHLPSHQVLRLPLSSNENQK